IYFNAAFQTIASQAADAASQAVQAAVAREMEGRGEAIRLHLPSVQVSVVGNPEASFELFLETLVTPLVLNMLLACAAVFAMGREVADGTLSAWHREGGGHMVAGLLGKLAPYCLVYWLWCL